MATTLSRDDMVAVIRGGGSVIHRGALHTSVDTLPTEADLAQGDAAKTQEVLDGIAALRAQLDAQEQKLLAAQGQQAAARTKRGRASTDPSTDQNPGGDVDPNAPAE